MGFFCNTDIPRVSPHIIIDSNTQRENGLDCIHSLTLPVNMCLEGFENPTYTMDGAIKLTTGLTCTLTAATLTTGPCAGVCPCVGLYNISLYDDFDLTFEFTGSTDYTGYTGCFCYKVFEKPDWRDTTATGFLSDGNEIFDRCFPFSGITGTTIVSNVDVANLPLLKDNQFLIRGYTKFEPNVCLTGLTVNTWDIESQSNLFSNDTDYYFATTQNPPTPIHLSTTSDNPQENLRLVQDNLGSGSGIANQEFVLTQLPQSDISVYVNGILLKGDGDDYTITTPSIGIRVVSFTEIIETTDIVTAVYLVGESTTFFNSNIDLFKIDTFIVTGFTSGVTASTVNIVNNNTTTGAKEVFLTNNVGENTSVIASVNGVTLTFNEDYFLSTSVPNRLIFIVPIEVGDILSFLYFTEPIGFNGDLGSLLETNVDITWSVTGLQQPGVVEGDFIVQVAEKTDTNYDTVLFSATTPYVTNQITYSVNIPDLTLDLEYIYRICFIKTYNASLDNQYITISYSSDGQFDTKSSFLINSY